METAMKHHKVRRIHKIQVRIVCVFQVKVHHSAVTIYLLKVLVLLFLEQKDLRGPKAHLVLKVNLVYRGHLELLEKEAHLVYKERKVILVLLDQWVLKVLKVLKDQLAKWVHKVQKEKLVQLDHLVLREKLVQLDLKDRQAIMELMDFRVHKANKDCRDLQA